MASRKRDFPEADQEVAVSPPNKTNQSPSSPPSPSISPPRVVLNPADCDLDFNIECNGLVGHALHEQGFGYCWSGARATIGITRGRYCYGCKILSAQPVHIDDTAPDQRHVCRLGISTGGDRVGSLGESQHSFGYGGTGKFSNRGKFESFGERFGVGDTIVCCVDLDAKPLASIGFAKNGRWLGTAGEFDVGCLGLGEGKEWESAVFPHVLLKNVAVRMQFSVEDGLVPKEGFKPWAAAVEDGEMVMGPALADKGDCEVMMMVGLPASGKSTWAEKWVKDHPEKRYVLLGTNCILDQMKVPGLLRKQNYGERFDCLMDRATEIFNVLLSRAANIPRNYIIDQTNVYKNARRRKLKPFADYQKIAVVVFPKPEELRKRSEKRFREMGKEVPPDAVNTMIANYVLPKSKDMPHSDEFFDQVMFVELIRGESQKYLDQMKQDLSSPSNNDPSTLSRGGSFPPSAGSGLQSQGCLTGNGVLRRDSYSPISPPSYGMLSQVNADRRMTELHGSMNSLSGVYPSSQIPHVARARPPPLPYSYNESSFPSDNAGYDPNYGVIPRGDIEACSHSRVDGQYRSNIVGNNMVPPGAFPNPYMSSMNEPSPIASARRMAFNHSTPDRPYSGDRDFRPDLHTPSPTSYSLSRYGPPAPRPTYEEVPDSLRYPGRYAPQRPRYS